MMPITQSTKELYESKGFGSAIRVIPPYGLLLVDFCSAFVDEERLGGGNIARAAHESRQLLEEARRRNWPVTHSQIIFEAPDLSSRPWLEKVPALKDLTETNPAAGFVAEVAPAKGELVIRKAVPSAFFQSDLHEWLQGKGVLTLIIAGCTTSGCVRATAIDAVSHGYRPVIVSDCVGDRSLTAHDASLCDLDAKYANVMDRSTILKMAVA